MKFENILCVSDLSFVSRNAEHAALRLAHQLNSKLTILSCGEHYAHVPNNYFDENSIQPIDEVFDESNFQKYINQKKKETVDYFSKLQKKLNLNLGDNIIYSVALENEVTSTIEFLESTKKKFDLIIVGKQNNSHWERFLFGSPAKEICDVTKIPTLFIPSNEEWNSWMPKNILASISLNDPKHKVELLGVQISHLLQIKMTLFHVIDLNNYQFSNNFSHIYPIDYIPIYNESEQLNEIITETRAKIDDVVKNLVSNYKNTNIEIKIEIGKIIDNVLEFLKSTPENNLLIIGSRGENALKRFLLGSNTDALEESCSIPILIVFDHSKLAEE